MIEPTDEMVEAVDQALDEAAGTGMGEARAAARAMLTLAKRDARRIVDLLRDLTDPDPCTFDHHGYCQAHGWMATEPRCPHARAKEMLGDAP